MYRFVQILMKWSWRLLFAGLFLLVLLIALSRLLFTGLPLVQQDITDFLSRELNADLRFDYMSSDWRGGAPRLSIRGLTLTGSNAKEPGFSVGRFDMELNLRASLLHWHLVFNTLEINDVTVEMVQGDGARWSLLGIDQIAGSSANTHAGFKGRFIEWVNYQHHLNIRDIELNLTKPDGENTRVASKYLVLSQKGAERQVATRLEAGEGYIEIKGKGIKHSLWISSWNGTLTANEMDLEHLCALWSGCQDDIITTKVELDTGWEYRQGVWQMYGRVSAPDVMYRSIFGDWRTLAGNTDLFLTFEPDHRWQIWLNELNLSYQFPDSKKDMSIPQQWGNSWYLSGNMGSEYSITLANEQVNLDELKRWLLGTGFVPPNAAELLTTLNPYGDLKYLAMRLYPQRQPFDIDLSARLVDVSVDAWKGAPSGGNVNGSVRMGLLKGYLDLDTENFALGLTKLFRETWYFDTAKGRLAWDVIDDTYILKSESLALKGPEGALKAKLRLDIPLQGEEDDTLDMALTVGITDGDARFTGKYLPALLPMDDGLVDWLDTSVKSAHLTTGGFLYNGALVGATSPHDSRWGLYFDLEDGHLQYAPEWPDVTALSGELFINDDRVLVEAQSAQSAGGQLKNVRVTVPLDDEPELTLDSQIVADGKIIKHFLTKTPIDEALNGEARHWNLQGKMNADLTLHLPFDDMEAYSYQLNADVRDFLYADAVRNIEVSHIQGALQISSENGFEAESLQGHFLEEPTLFSVHTGMDKRQPKSVNIGLSGGVSVLQLQQWLRVDWLSLLEGATQYQGNLKIDLESKKINLAVSSDLQGLEIEMPAPLGKVADKTLAFTLDFELGNQPFLNASLGDVGRASVFLTADYSMDSAAIVLGIEDELPDRQPGKFLIRGSLTELDLEPWSQRFGSQPGNASEQKVANRLQVDNVRIKQLRYGEQKWADLLVSINSDEQMTRLLLHGKEISGSLGIPVAPYTPYRLELDHLHLPDSHSVGNSNQGGEQDLLADIKPDLLPEADILIKSLQLGNKPPTSLSVRVRQQENGVRADNLQYRIGGMKVTGFADWTKVDGEHRTRFKGRLQGENIGQFQQFMGTPEVVSAESSQVDINVNWAGSPLGVRFKEVAGKVDINLKDGRLTQGENRTGALKLFGILNTETFRRRLQLDFSDLYASGIAFDDLTGRLRFDQGIVSFIEPMLIDGPNSSLELDGTANAVNQLLDLNLVITLPVTSSLPILSVLLGSAPQVAGIIFIADKLVGKQVNKLASIHYRIKGSFDNPAIGLDQSYSDTKGQKK